VVEGVAGSRRRGKDAALHTLALSNDVLIALPSAAAAAGWLAVDEKSQGLQPTPPAPPPGPSPSSGLIKVNLAEAIEASASRPLQQLILAARTPAGGKLLSQLAQPFGASSITLSVSVAGDVKGGGTMALNIEGVKHTHPVKPLDVAGAIANSLTSTDSFEASLTLEFEPGLLMAGDHLKALADRDDDLRVSCTFGASVGGGT
jgi:hypothetical protein